MLKNDNSVRQWATQISKKGEKDARSLADYAWEKTDYAKEYYSLINKSGFSLDDRFKDLYELRDRFIDDLEKEFSTITPKRQRALLNMLIYNMATNERNTLSGVYQISQFINPKSDPYDIAEVASRVARAVYGSAINNFKNQIERHEPDIEVDAYFSGGGKADMIIKEGGTNSLIDMQKIKPIDFLETIEKHSEILRNNVIQMDDNRLKDREIKNSQISM